MQLSFNAEVQDVMSHKEFWASLGEVALKGQKWRLQYDPWEGVVVEINEDRAQIVLRNMSRPDLELQMYLGRALVDEESWEKLAMGVIFFMEFKEEDGQGSVELSFP